MNESTGSEDDHTGQWSTIEFGGVSPDGSVPSKMVRRHALEGIAVGTLLFSTLVGIGVTVFRNQVERSLTRQTKSALTEAGFGEAVVAFRGRDAQVRVPSGIQPSEIRDVVLSRTVPKTGGRLGGLRTVLVLEDKAIRRIGPTAATTEVTSVPSPALIPEDGSVTAIGADTSDVVTETQSALEELLSSQIIEFAAGSPVLSDRGRSVVNAAARLILSQPGIAVLVIGHTDDRGTPETNQQLSKQRASAVASALIEEGVPSALVSSEGRGSAEPLSDNLTLEGRTKNRRIQVLLSARP
jgi:OmpA-OmpF porin, OOP family